MNYCIGLSYKILTKTSTYTNCAVNFILTHMHNISIHNTIVAFIGCYSAYTLLDKLPLKYTAQ